MMKLKVFKSMVVSIIILIFTPNFAMADSFVVDGITYSSGYTPSEVTVKELPNTEDIAIPGSIIYNGIKYNVTVIDTWAFSNCNKLIELTLPPTLRYFWGNLDNCYSLDRINISSMYDFMELSVGRSIFVNKDVELYLNGKLVTHVDIVNAEPKDALRGYEKLRSVTFCSTATTTIKSDILNGCSNIDSLCFKSPNTTLDYSSNIPIVKNIFFYGDVSTEGRVNFKASFAYIKKAVSCKIWNYNNTLSAGTCIIDCEDDYAIPNLSVDTCIITPKCPNKGNFTSPKSPFGGCKNMIFLSPRISVTVPLDDQTYYVINKDSATVEWSDYQKRSNMNRLKLIYGMKKPVTNLFEYSGQSPLVSIDIKDSTDVVHTSWDAYRQKKDVGDYDEMPITFNVHGMNFDTSLPYEYSISKAPLKIIANNIKREYDKENPVFSCTYIGFKNGENEDVLDEKPILYTLASRDSFVGLYPIIPSNAYSQNYSIDYMNGTLTIVPASQKIIWEQDLNKVKVGDIIELSATSSANLKVKFTSSNTAVAEIYASNGKNYVEFLTAGIVRITAYQAGDSNHLEADDVAKRIIVEENESTAISSIESEKNRIIGYYSLDGKRVGQPIKGFYIAKYANGFMKKILVK